VSSATDHIADTAQPPAPARLRVVLLAVIAVCLAAVAVAGGYLWGSRGDPTASAPSTTSVDAGFARDMSTHHTQAVTMANYERDNTTSKSLRLLAYDIETSQQFQIGQMQGWLDVWGLSRSTSQQPMAWMAGHEHLTADGLMPGMATPDQIDKLLASHGTALDILFLQLMIHHHQGGVVMANYTVQHATQDEVRTLAQSIATAQTNEIVQMEALLRQLGGTPLPPPST
jgi:uncharacterized protein (DUF305 family)